MSRGHFIWLIDHRVMLSDRVRMKAFREAIAATVLPGDVVLDLGTGTGILAMWAAQAGARRVFAIDPAPVVRLAERFAADNEGCERIEFIEADARAVDLDEPVDVLISECLGNFFVTDELAPVLRDAARHLKPDARVVPAAVELWMAPLFYPQLDDVSFWDREHYGLDLSAGRSFALRSTYNRHVDPRQMMAPPAMLQRFPLLQSPDTVGGSLRFTLTRASTVDAFAGWFDADMGGGATLSTRPGVDTHWAQMVMPVEPVRAPAGATVELSVELAMDSEYESRWRWSGRFLGPGGEVLGEFAHDTDQRFNEA